MTRRYHIPETLRWPNDLSAGEREPLQSTILDAIRRAVESAASLSGGAVAGDEGDSDAVTESFSSERYRADREMYAIPSYDNGGQLRELPVTDRDASPVAVHTFADLWEEFGQHRSASRNADARALVPDLLTRMSTDEALERSRGLAFWLLDQGEWSLAQDALERLEMAWWMRSAMSGARVPGRSVVDDPHTLASRAMDEARAAHHEQAFQLFGLAFLFSQMQFQEMTERREADLTRTESGLERFGPQRFTMGESLTMWGRMFNYSDTSSIIDLMREILGFYPSLEIEALRAGGQALAAQYGGLGLLLRTELRDRYMLSGARGITMESSQTLAPGGGIGYTIYGRNARQEVVTPLPGTRTPQEIGFFPSYTSTMEELLESISGQEEFLATLNSHPEIRAAFGTRRINMSDLNERLQVWRIMYRIFQRERLNPLNSLIRLMEEYLKYFTRHTEYNIRDFGVSYLSTEFPEDLAGRVVRDCGVYALTVAYEVYRTARGATPRLDLDFRLYAMPEHVTLAIIDLAETNYYVVNNNRIEGPRLGDVLEGVARAYAATFSRPYTVTPAVRVDIGSTRIADVPFRQLAWQNYRASTQWGFPPEPPAGAADTRTEGERAQAIYRRYYQDQDNFTRGSQRLRQQLDQLSQSLQRAANEAERRTLLNTALPALSSLGSSLIGIFDMFGPHVQINAANAQVRSLIGGHSLYLFYSDDNRRNPLARFGMVLMLFESMGNTLTSDQQRILQWLRAIPQFRENLDQYRAAGYQLAL
jgi:hypothetical protein